MRSFSTFATIALATLTLGAAAVYAQTAAPSPSNCGVETWSTDKMAYVNVPCPGGTATTGQTAAAPGSSGNCGVETWSTDKMTYVTTPCAHGTTYENPSAKPTENPNTK